MNDRFIAFYVSLIFLFISSINIGFCEKRAIDSLQTMITSAKNDSNKINLIFSLCTEFQKISEFDKVIPLAIQANNLSRKLKYGKGQAIAFSFLGTVYRKKGNYSKAVDYYDNSVKIYKRINNKKELSSVYNKLGVTFWRQGIYPKALENFFESLKLAEAIKDTNGIANALGNIGLIYTDQENYNEALIYNEKALQIFIDIGNKKEIAASFTNIGNIYSQQRKFEPAIQIFNKSLKIKREIGDREGEVIVMINISLVYIDQGKFADAQKVVGQALIIAKEIDSKFHIAESYKLLGIINFKLNKLKEAKNNLTTAISIGNNLESIDLLKSCFRELTKVDSALGNWKLAFENHKKYIFYRDSIFNEENTREITEQQLHYDFEKKEAKTQAKQAIKDAIAKKELQQQKFASRSFMIGFAIVLLFAILFLTQRNKIKLEKKKSDELLVKVSKQKIEVEEQRNIVQFQNKEILSSIEYAKRIQATILPPPKVVKKYLEDSFILYLPKDIVAGDFYWMETSPIDENVILFAACDCTGHGVPGALVSVVCSNALNRVVKEYGIVQSSKILDKVAEIVVADFSKDENENVQDGMDVSFCSYDSSSGILNWAGANNPLWIIKNGQLIEIKGDKQPVGKMDNIKPFTNHQIKLDKGDTIYLFTDGFADQFGGDKNKKLSKKNFKEVLLSIQNKNLDEQRKLLFEFFNSYKNSNEQVDDILIMGVRV